MKISQGSFSGGSGFFGFLFVKLVCGSRQIKTLYLYMTVGLVWFSAFSKTKYLAPSKAFSPQDFLLSKQVRHVFFVNLIQMICL